MVAIIKYGELAPFLKGLEHGAELFYDFREHRYSYSHVVSVEIFYPKGNFIHSFYIEFTENFSELDGKMSDELEKLNEEAREIALTHRGDKSFNYEEHNRKYNRKKNEVRAYYNSLKEERRERARIRALEFLADLEKYNLVKGSYELPEASCYCE